MSLPLTHAFYLESTVLLSPRRSIIVRRFPLTSANFLKDLAHHRRIRIAGRLTGTCISSKGWKALSAGVIGAPQRVAERPAAHCADLLIPALSVSLVRSLLSAV